MDQTRRLSSPPFPLMPSGPVVMGSGSRQQQEQQSQQQQLSQQHQHPDTQFELFNLDQFDNELKPQVLQGTMEFSPSRNLPGGNGSNR